MNDLQLNAEGAETHGAGYRAGIEAGKADCLRGFYIPDREPPSDWGGCENRADWHEGYEAGWEAAFFEKVQQRREQPQLNFPNQNQHTS